MIGLEGLQDDFAPQRAAAGPPGHLGQQLEGAFAGVVIGQLQAHIRQHHPHQRHQGQIQSFRQHLRADQDIGLVVHKRLQQQVMRAFLAGGFGIPAQGAHAREQLLYIAFYFFGAGAKLADLGAAALRARFGHLAAVIAGVADQPTACRRGR